MERKKLAEQILEAVGTKDNVVSLVHCMTRLRFTLKDVHKVKEEELKNLPGVLGVTENGGQYQIIIGNEVPKVYQEVTGLLPSAASASSDNEKPVKMNVFLRMVNVLSSCMTPIVPALAGAGILKVILSVLILTNLTTAENQTYYYLSFFADATFYFLPILLAITSAAKFRTNVYLAVTLAGILLHPKFTAVIAAKEPSFLFGLPVTLINYSSTVIPIIITVWLMSYVERFAEKYSPAVFKTFLKPLIVIIVMAPVSLIAIGPLGYYLGYGLAQVIYFLQENMGWLALAILSGFKPLLVMTGMHWAFTPAIITSIATYGYDGLMAVSSLSAIFSLTGACFATALKTKKAETRQISVSAGITSLLTGITEPAIYGVAIRFKKTMVIVVISGFLSGIFAGFTKLKIFALVAPGLLKMPSFISDQYPDNFVNALITAAIAITLSFVLTYLYGFEEEPENMGKEAAAGLKAEVNNQEPSPDSMKNHSIFSPVKGKTLPLSAIDDKVFSLEVIGKGIAVMPSEGKIVSPVSGTISAVTESRHAVGITSEDGIEVLVHVGIDTVKLEGQYFNTLVKIGDQVRTGDTLLEFDMQEIEKAGYSLITPVIISNSDNYLDVIGNTGRWVNSGDVLLSVLGKEDRP